MTALLVVMLVFSPLVKGGNAPMPLLILELLALLVLARLVFLPAFRQQLSGWTMTALAAAVLLPLLYLLPLPTGLWGILPGRAQYLEMMQFSIDLSEPLTGRALSLLPFSTEAGWYALLVPVTVFLATVGQSNRKLALLVRIVLGVAVFQALLGLFQYFQGPDSVLRLGNPYYLDSAVGTYVNRSHLAGLLSMALPIAVAVAIGPLADGRSDLKQNDRSVVVRLRPWFSAVLILLLLVGLVFTRSRAGIALGLMGLVSSTLLFSVGLGSRKLLLVLAIVLLAGLAVVGTIGLEPVIARFASPDTIDNERWPIFAAAWQGALQFFPLGAGPATFPQVFPAFQPGDMSGFVNRAHNDYLEAFFDGGIILLAPVLMLLLLYVLCWTAFVGHGRWSRFQLLQVAAGTSVLMLLLHSLLDFNLHIPANAVYFGFFAGVFFRRSSSHRRTGSASKASAKPSAAPVRVIPDENLVNPFDTDDVATNSG